MQRITRTESTGWQGNKENQNAYSLCNSTKPRMDGSIRNSDKFDKSRRNTFEKRLPKTFVKMRNAEVVLQIFL